MTDLDRLLEIEKKKHLICGITVSEAQEHQSLYEKLKKAEELKKIFDDEPILKETK